MAGTLGAIQPFRYRGYVYDEETELYYLRSRYYNTEWTRFLSIDEYVGRGSFNYTSNNCINLIDSEGKEAVLIAYGTVKLLAVAYTGVLALIIGVAVGDATKNSYKNKPSEYDMSKVDDENSHIILPPPPPATLTTPNPWIVTEYKEHVTNQWPSNLPKHQKGNAVYEIREGKKVTANENRTDQIFEGIIQPD